MRRLIAGSAIAAAVLLTGSVQGAAVATSAPTRHANYHVVNLPSLGGTSSAGTSINNRGWVAGISNLPGDQVQHAALWRHGSILDLGTLGGPDRNSGVLWPVKSERGVIVGISQTAQPDPLGERWSCSAFFPAATGTGYQCLGFVWEDGVMRPLPTLGGTNGFATGVNNRGQIVGWAENTVHDPTCVAPQVLQFRAVVWGPKEGEILELPPLPGDTVSAATAINNRDQVVGISGICDRAVGRFSAIHAVLWEDGQPIDLGSFGGVAWNTPMAINERGDVVGFSNVSAAAGGGFSAHAFLWTKREGIRDLGTLPGDSTSQALGINARGEIVGTSCDAAFNCRAFLWRDGVMTELNTLVTADYEDTLTTANDINNSGRITGQALEQGTGALVAFVARP
jgi:probable HAF family extracellular repeat protein